MDVQVRLAAPLNVVVQLDTPSVINLQLQDVSLINVVGEKYEGAYDVTPSTYTDKVLTTQNLVMTKDVTVRKIPQYEVSNEAGGTTFIIGEEYHG